MPSKIRDNSGSKTTVFQTDCAKLNIISKKRTALCSLKNDAPCLTYVNSDTSLYQNSCGGYQTLKPKHKCSAADSIGTQLHLFNFQDLIFVRGFILSYSEKFVKAFLNIFFAFWK